MKEYMLVIRNRTDSQATWPAERLQRFLDASAVYIENLKQTGRLIAAQPLVKQGRIVSRETDCTWHETPLSLTGEVQVGYYHIRAQDMDEAVSLAKGNPEFECGSTATVEVRPIVTEEPDSGYVYPSSVSAQTTGNTSGFGLPPSSRVRQPAVRTVHKRDARELHARF